jgi:GST-like protein
MANTARSPIELHYWPTPNGWKITIMLEECAYPYTIRFVNIVKGEQFASDFLKIAPNNRMPAMIDPDGPGGAPISIFESGAILQYLGNKTGKFYPAAQRQRSEVEQWLFWQMANLGPMSGQAGHFRNYARETLPYAIDRYTNEVARLYRVMDTRLADREFLAGDYSIADMASYPWTISHERLGQKLTDFPNMKRWYDTIAARPAVVRAVKVGEERRTTTNLRDDDEAQEILFGIRRKA